MKYNFRDIVIDSRTGLNPRKNFKLGRGNNYYITIKDIHEGKVIISDKTDRIEDKAIEIIKKRSRIKNGDILFTSIGRIGDTAIVKDKDDTWDVNESVFVFTVNERIITPEYFCLLFETKSVQSYLRMNISGSTFKSVKMNQLEKMIFELPSLEEQKFITETILKSKRIIELRRKQIFELDYLIKSRFVEMFGDPVKNEKNWETRKLDDVCPVNKYKGQVDSTNGQVWLLNLDKIESDTGKILNYVLEDESKIASSTIKFDTNCVLYSKLRPYLNKVVIPPRSGYATSEMIAMQTNIVDKYFLSSLLRMKSFVDFANGTSYGAKMPRASVDMIKNFDLIFPPKELQNSFAQFAQQVDKLKFVVQKSLDETQKLFDSLMQEYFG